MKILIGLYELENFYGGVQTWTITILNALRSIGHDVEVYTHKKNINKFLSWVPLSKGFNYDIIICNSNVVLKELKCYSGKKVFISHGILPELEQPVEGADFYVAVSEEVANNIEYSGFKVSGILRNPIDCQNFYFVGCSSVSFLLVLSIGLISLLI